ncbi:hypothetical protein SHANETTE_37 [Bacillus phage Shanette]|uniref:Uncharacterized protein n=1 Tax=Bacillus phage Shanette TaxID=1296656 RepID=S5MAY6_9CAUD|nr:hypothetical protein AVV46_gp037 [Bacillus phage Shanette]AGR46939.1 hypothetical protein SHANETTE_37 [Bacillus phage Shanette]
MANQEVDLSCINEFRREVQIAPEFQLLIAGVQTKCQIEPQILYIYNRGSQLRVKRLIIPNPVMDTFMVPEIVSFKLTREDTGYTLEGDCCLDACVEGYASEHYRALEDVVLSIRLK